MPKCDFSKVALQLWHRCSPVDLLHIFTTSFTKNTFTWLLLCFLPFTKHKLASPEKILDISNSCLYYCSISLIFFILAG